MRMGDLPGRRMGTKRQGYEPSHKPKCLVIVDETPECDRAVHYAARWAQRMGGQVVMLHVIETVDRNQEWLGVADIMKAEADAEAHDALDRALVRARDFAKSAVLSDLVPERVIREGVPAEQIRALIETDTDIVLLILAAAGGPEGPGPIVTATAKVSGTFPIPVTVVPGHLADDEIDGML